jgi:hypothetical protein
MLEGLLLPDIKSKNIRANWLAEKQLKIVFPELLIHSPRS